ncbi:MAG: OmpH family outer membrane protein [Desulfobacula sp.]|nr:OmpH family outer membrane protein [Desulfobacula sp.]
MKKSIMGLAIIIFCLGFVSTGLCADVTKIGTFNIQKILNESSAGKIIQKQLRTKFNEFQEKLKTEKIQLDEMKKALEREALVLSAEKNNEKQREFRIRVNDFKIMQNDFAQEFKRNENQSKGKIVKEIFDIVGLIGKEEGYLIIFDEKNAGVFYRQDSLDITDNIIKRYNLKVSETK